MGNTLDLRVADRSHRSQLRFYVIGDFGSGDDGQARVAAAMALVAAREPPDFILGTGDSFYPLDGAGDGSNDSLAEFVAERFDRYYGPLGVDFFPCLGNEDLVDVFGGDATPMVAFTGQSATWRMPAPSYRLPGLPLCMAGHDANQAAAGLRGG